MLKMIIALLGLMMINSGAEYPSAVVDRIEGKYAVIEYCQDVGSDCIMVDVPLVDLNHNVTEGERLEISTIKGQFYSAKPLKVGEVRDSEYYQFVTDDGEIWLLTAEQIAGIDSNAPATIDNLEKIEHVPDYDSEFMLAYYDNNTGYKHDDIFISITKIKNNAE